MSLLKSIISLPLRIILVIVGLIILALTLAMYFSGKKENLLPILAMDEIVILRTPGGMLEVTTLVRNEEFRWSTKHTCPLIDCGSLFGATVSEVRVPVHYTYRIPLAAEWSLKFKGSYFELLVPQVEPKLPTAVDVSKLEIRSNGTWFSPNSAKHRESVVRNLGPDFDKRSKQKNYLDAQRADAKKTGVEFAQKWMMTQGVDPSTRGYPIRVFFPDDARLP